MRSEGYCTWLCVCVSVCCVSVCLCVCLSPVILALQGPSRLISDTNGSSATRARKVMWQFCSDKATYLHGPLTDSGSVEQWQFYDGEARVLERYLGFSETVAWLYGGEQVECLLAS